jgi:hypothetical protein
MQAENARVIIERTGHSGLNVGIEGGKREITIEPEPIERSVRDHRRRIHVHGNWGPKRREISAR